MSQDESRLIGGTAERRHEGRPWDEPGVAGHVPDVRWDGRWRHQRVAQRQKTETKRIEGPPPNDVEGRTDYQLITSYIAS